MNYATTEIAFQGIGKSISPSQPNTCVRFLSNLRSGSNPSADRPHARLKDARRNRGQDPISRGDFNISGAERETHHQDLPPFLTNGKSEI
jgi:hypothetical protein